MRQAIRIKLSPRDDVQSTRILTTAENQGQHWVDGAMMSASLPSGLKDTRVQVLGIDGRMALGDEEVDFGQWDAIRYGYNSVEQFFFEKDEEKEPSDNMPLELFNEYYRNAYFLGTFSFMGPHIAQERGHLALGAALAESDDLAGAIDAFHEAIRLGEGDILHAAMSETSSNS